MDAKLDTSVLLCCIDKSLIFGEILDGGDGGIRTLGTVTSTHP